MRRMQLAVVVPAVVMVGCTNISKYPVAPPVPEVSPVSYQTPYYLQPGDTLAVKLLLNPELNEEVTVGPDGRISTMVANDIPAAGKTVGQVAAELRNAYRKDVANARVSVSVRTFNPTRVYVGGEVFTPGEFITANGPPLSLSQAIARAGGLRTSGDSGNVFIIRRSTPTAPAEFLGTHYSAVMHADDPSADVILAPGDVIYVPRTGIAEVYAWYHEYIEQFAHPSVGFTYVINNPTGSTVIPTGTTTTTTPTATAR